MNIFEDWIDELKKENLLEKTVSETAEAENNAPPAIVKQKSADISDKKFSLEPSKSFSDFEQPKQKTGQESPLIKNAAAADAGQPAPKKNVSVNQNDFFRKRAIDEVGGLQTVEHVFSGVERQQKKLVPKIYDDLNVKKALHEFLQISGSASASEIATGEFQLMQETESWYSALSHRDKQISIAHLRRYCETTKPGLSSQALIALARFYRNSPYSEAVRSKFDLITTRLFTKETGGEKREVVFQRDDLVRHLSELYAEWESVSVYSNGEQEDDESEILLMAFQFEDFMSEAENAGSFDELVKKDFFNRLRTFKQSTSERFFAPLICAAAIESNVRIGNRYIDLLEREKENGDFEKLENKYGFLHDQVISDATSKTLELVQLLKLNVKTSEKTADKPTPSKAVAKESLPEKIETRYAEAPPSVFDNIKSAFFAVNKWLLASSIVVLLLSVGIYIRAEMMSAETPAAKASQNVKTVNLENSSLNEFMRDARVGNNTFFAVVKPSWESLSEDAKKEILRKIAVIGVDKNFKSVRLLSTSGKTVGAVAPGDFIEVGN